ncbi:dihydropteroate synthase [Gammaproteobacteria bacterium AS21]|jgi:dihydropteroate synthase
MNKLKCGDRQLELSKTHVMGILNVTPDSFSDGGSLFTANAIDKDALLMRAQAMVLSGATILDIGGESTRPNAEEVTSQQEMDRVLPALELLSANLDVVLSVDTSNPALISVAADYGAGMINDVRALEREGAVQAVARGDLPVCLMHMQGTPATMQNDPLYKDVTTEVLSYLLSRADVCKMNGIDRQRIILDPGFGFGKTLEQNVKLLKDTDVFVASGYAVLIGTSRKSMFGQLLGRAVDDRLAASLSSVAYAAMKGAFIVRVHDVQATCDVVKVIAAINDIE